MSTLGDNLRAARKVRRLTQYQAADLSHVSQSNISYYETGKSSPSIAVLRRLAAAYGVSVARLVRAV